MEPPTKAENETYFISVAGDLTVIGWTDQDGDQAIMDLPTSEARKFFKSGMRATAPWPRTLGSLWWHRLQVKLRGGHTSLR